ncbi:MAG: hypothetical protein AAGA56_27355, partial [Myxococcota bacterium]
ELVTAEGLPDVPVELGGCHLEFFGGDASGMTRSGTRSPVQAVNVAARRKREGGDRDQTTLARIRYLIGLARVAAKYSRAVYVEESNLLLSAPDFLERTVLDHNPLLLPGANTLVGSQLGANGAWVSSRGHWLYGLPDVGISLGGPDAHVPSVHLLAEVGARMVTEDYAPFHGEAISGHFADRRSTVLWLEGLRPSRPLHRNAYDVSFISLIRRRGRCRALAEADPWELGFASPKHRIHVLQRHDGLRRITTCGLGLAPRPGIPEHGEPSVELFADVEGEHAAVAAHLTMVADAIFSADPSRPVRFYDQIPLPSPRGGIVGLGLIPRERVSPMDGREIVNCAVVPLAAHELDRHRSTASPEAWEAAVDGQGLWRDVQRRWASLRSA